MLRVLKVTKSACQVGSPSAREGGNADAQGQILQ